MFKEYISELNEGLAKSAQLDCGSFLMMATSKDKDFIYEIYNEDLELSYKSSKSLTFSEAFDDADANGSMMGDNYIVIKVDDSSFAPHVVVHKGNCRFIDSKFSVKELK